MPSRRSAFSLGNSFSTLGPLALGALLLAPGLAGANDNSWSIEILSSAPDQVSGGDVLVRVGFPGSQMKANAALLLNGEDVTSSLATDDGTLVGVIDGLVLGDNLFQLKPRANASTVKASLVARNHPSSTSRRSTRRRPPDGDWAGFVGRFSSVETKSGPRTRLRIRVLDPATGARRAG